MLDKWETMILSSLQVIFDEFGWAGVFGLMIFENVTGITPSEIILAFAGWMLIERHGIAPTLYPARGFICGAGQRDRRIHHLLGGAHRRTSHDRKVCEDIPHGYVHAQ